MVTANSTSPTSEGKSSSTATRVARPALDKTPSTGSAHSQQTKGTMKIGNPIAGVKMFGAGLLAVALLAGSTSPVGAVISIFISPSSQAVGTGGTGTFDLKVSGLELPPALGAWAVEINYDDSIVQIDAFGFGSLLDFGTFGSAQSGDASTLGTISLDEVSFEDPADLVAGQSPEFALATVSFTGLVPGVSPLGISILELSDENGFALEGVAVDGSITVRDSRSVPEGFGIAPAALAWGLLLLLAAAKLSKSRKAVA
jgi:hypothetical protein